MQTGTFKGVKSIFKFKKRNGSAPNMNLPFITLIKFGEWAYFFPVGHESLGFHNIVNTQGQVHAFGGNTAKIMGSNGNTNLTPTDVNIRVMVLGFS